tara:strand:- start:1852 stop:2835 length:984 start_codon:yes stop_codon:yes gene_type:complete
VSEWGELLIFLIFGPGLLVLTLFCKEMIYFFYPSQEAFGEDDRTSYVQWLLQFVILETAAYLAAIGITASPKSPVLKVGKSSIAVSDKPYYISHPSDGWNEFVGILIYLLTAYVAIGWVLVITSEKSEKVKLSKIMRRKNPAVPFLCSKMTVISARFICLLLAIISSTSAWAAHTRSLPWYAHELQPEDVQPYSFGSGDNGVRLSLNIKVVDANCGNSLLLKAQISHLLINDGWHVENVIDPGRSPFAPPRVSEQFPVSYQFETALPFELINNEGIQDGEVFHCLFLLKPTKESLNKYSATQEEVLARFKNGVYFLKVVDPNLKDSQ